MVNTSPMSLLHDLGPVSDWIERWTHLVPPHGTVLDIACGRGRHMQWFSEKGHPTFGIDRSPEAIHAAASFGEAVLADIENAPWPLLKDGQARQFDAVIVTNYLWRPLFPVLIQSISPGGLLIYETFAKGNETVGKPSQPDFLLHPAELLQTFENMHIIAFEEGFLENPPRFVQRIVAVHPDLRAASNASPARYTL